jgi:uncharacterized protein
MTTINQVMSYIRTFSGKLVDPVHLTPDDVCIEDIAHALSNQCRFSGHVRRFYSVAEHSVRVMKKCKLDPLAALLHDASETYLVDLPRPLKYHPQFAFYKEVEAWVTGAIEERFSLIDLPEIREEIHIADKRMLATEMAGLMNRQDSPLPFEPYADYANVRLGLSPMEAERWFLANYRELVKPPL